MKTGSDRSFGLLFTVVFVVVGLWPLRGGGEVRGWALGVAGVLLGVVAVGRAAWLHPLNVAWMMFGALLHKVTQPVILGVLYWLVFVPVGLVMRLAGRDPMGLKFDAGQPTYWVKRQSGGPEPVTMRQQF